MPVIASSPPNAGAAAAAAAAAGAGGARGDEEDDVANNADKDAASHASDALSLATEPEPPAPATGGKLLHVRSAVLNKRVTHHLFPMAVSN
jgi:hypothetical protein